MNNYWPKKIYNLHLLSLTVLYTLLAVFVVIHDFSISFLHFLMISTEYSGCLLYYPIIFLSTYYFVIFLLMHKMSPMLTLCNSAVHGKRQILRLMGLPQENLRWHVASGGDRQVSQTHTAVDWGQHSRWGNCAIHSSWCWILSTCSEWEWMNKYRR